MANKFISHVLSKLGKNKDVKDLPAFWDLIGRTDLREITEHAQLAGAPTLQTALYEAKRVIKRRNVKVLELEDGRTLEVIRKGDKPPAPLTHFLLSGDNYGDGEVRYFERRVTKGWRWEKVSEYEVKAYRDRGVRLLADIPGRGEIRKRRVA